MSKWEEKRREFYIYTREAHMDYQNILQLNIKRRVKNGVLRTKVPYDTTFHSIAWYIMCVVGGGGQALQLIDPTCAMGSVFAISYSEMF